MTTPAVRPRRPALSLSIAMLLLVAAGVSLAGCDALAPGPEEANARAAGGVAAHERRTFAPATCPCYTREDVQAALAFDRGWVTLWDATFGTLEDGTRHVLLDNDVPSAVWTLGVERDKGSYSCRYSLYTPRIHRKADSLTVAQADACRTLAHEVMACGWQSVYGPSNSCGRSFADDVRQRIATRTALPRAAAAKMMERARLTVGV